jgi:hypothetical protein
VPAGRGGAFMKIFIYFCLEAKVTKIQDAEKYILKFG